MLGLGTLRKDAPLQWAAVIAIRLVLVGTAILFGAGIALTPTRCMSRTTRARAEISEIGNAVRIHMVLTGRMPASLDDLRLPLERNGGEPILDVGDAPWGHPFGFVLDGPGAFTVLCLGADGEFGGEGNAADLVLRWPSTDEHPPR